MSATQIKTVKKTGSKARVDFIRDLNGVTFTPHVLLTVYESASRAKLVKVKGVWLQLTRSRLSRRFGYQLDLRKPYKWPTRARKSATERQADHKKKFAAALKRAEKVLTKSDLKALGLVK